MPFAPIQICLIPIIETVHIGPILIWLARLIIAINLLLLVFPLIFDDQRNHPLLSGRVHILFALLLGSPLYSLGLVRRVFLAVLVLSEFDGLVEWQVCFLFCLEWYV